MNKEFKLSVVEIAKELKITPSAVSRYLNLERGRVINIFDFPEIVKELKLLANDIISNHPSRNEIELRLFKIALHALRKKYLCGYHQKLYPSETSPTCRICPEIFSEIKS